MPVLLFLLAFLFSGVAAFSQKEFDGLRGTHNWIGFSDAPNALYHHIAAEAYEDLDRRQKEVDRIHTLAEWQRRQGWQRRMLQEGIGPFPSRTPLNAVITRVVAKDGYHFEHIIFESQPGYYVTSTLFVPDGAAGAPAIVYCSGHSDNGYRSGIYIHEILNFVRKGFVVFAFDPMGQGERLQYYDAAKGRSRFRYPSYEHSYAGAQLFMTGNTLARDFVWDGIRAVDYLCTRKEVDTGRIGITGRSGGGTQTAFIAAFDGRIKAAAPENYITNMRRLMQAMGPQDAEQNFMYGLARGLDMADILEVRAPAPTLVIATTQDMFPIQGTLETVDEVRRVYKAYGRPASFGLVTDDAPHASTRRNREAAYAFFLRVFHVAGSPVEEETGGLSDEELRVTATGQVSTSLHGVTAFDINRADAARRRAPFSLDAARRLSGYVRPGVEPAPWFAGRAQRKGYVIEKYLLKGEGDYMIPYIVFKPDPAVGVSPVRKAVVYLNALGKAADAQEDGDMALLARMGVMVVAPDLPGFGELGPGVFQGDSYVDSVSYNSWFAAMLIGRSIVGIQAGDVVRVVDQIKRDGIPEIYGLAKGAMSPVMLHAAAFDKDIAKVALIRPCRSYQAIATDSAYDPRLLYSTVAGAVGVYDLGDLQASLAPRPLLIAETISNELKKWIDQ